MIRYIIEGDIYITNMTQQLEVKSNKKPLDVFYDLRENNPSPFGGYMDYGDFQIVCASPERFLKMKKGHVNTRPIKGTRKRGETLEEDLLMRNDLKNSEKDKSELLMIVDLERNDLNRVCKPGSVKVTELFTVEEYATVFHLVSDIEGVLQENKTIMDLLEATFPGVFGKGEKMRYKDKLEFQIEVDSSILYIPLIKLVLQPIIENAIYHGLKYKESKGLLIVKGFMKDGNAVLQVIDDGVGMDEETLAHIYDKHKVNYHSNGVGVYNVQKRLKLYYGEDYGITYTSELGKGTTATITIPGRQEGQI